MRQSTQNHHKGFTLIEIIITIVMGSILAVMMFTYSMSLTGSSLSLARTTKTFDLQKVMENIFTDYNKTEKQLADLAAIKTKIGSTGSPQPLTTSYGTYTLVYNDFIKFAGNVATPIVGGDPQNMLKVTIKNDWGETLSILLTYIPT